MPTGYKGSAPIPTCHPDRKHHAYGLCSTCAQKKYNGERISKCHPERRHYAAGLCATCYRRERPPSVCHPNRPSLVGTICRPCYRKKIEYGADYNELLKKQGGKCALCEKPLSKLTGAGGAGIDHCHNTGKVRGLLCTGCNAGLGCFRDDKEILRKALAYLERCDFKVTA